MNKYKELIKNILLFALSSFIPKTIYFFLVPIYTAYLTTGEYGVSDLINTTVSLFMPIATLNIRDAVLRFSLDKKYNKKDCLNISLKIVCIDLILLIVLTVLQLNFKWYNLLPQYIIFFDIMLISNSIYDIFNSFCKGIEKIKTIVFASITNALLTFLLNMLLIVILHKGLLGFLLANSLSTIIALLVFIFHGKLYKYFSFKYSKTQAKAMIKYSFPIVFSSIAWWVNNASDRYIITWFVGVSASGIYAVSSKIPSILTTFQNVFMQAWSISAIKDFNENDNDGFIGNMYTLMSCMLCVLCSIIILFNLFISKIMFSGNFYVAWKYVPPLVLSVTFDGLTLFIGNLFYAVKDTKARTWTTILGAIINTILNLILIKKIGVYGAAIATTAGYASSFILSRLLIKKYLNMNTDMKRNDIILFFLIIQVILSYFGNQFIIAQLIISIVIIIIYKKEIFKVIEKITTKFILKSKII